MNLKDELIKFRNRLIKEKEEEKIADTSILGALTYFRAVAKYLTSL